MRPADPLWQRDRRRWFGPLVLAVLPLLVYGRFIALGDELANADVFLAYRPAHAWLAEGLRQGTIPLWNPYILGGFPLAFSEYGWFSPVNWLCLALFGGHSGFYLAVALYAGAASVAAYALARSWGASYLSALLAGLVYGQSLYVVGGAPLLNQGAAYWALPALLWCVERHVRGYGEAPPIAVGANSNAPAAGRDVTRRAAAPLAAVTVALLLLGSHPQLSVLVLLPPAAYALTLAAAQRTLRPLAALTFAGLAGVATAAVRYLPTLPLVAASVRAEGVAFAASAVGSVHPAALLTGLVFPSLTIPRVITAQWAAYLGPLPWLLAILWLCRRRDGVTLFLTAIGVAGGALALGSYTPLFWLIQQTPLLAYFREPSRFFLWTALAVACLAAFGLDAASQVAGQSRGRIGVRRVVTAAILAALPVAGFAATHVGLRAIEPRVLAWGHGRAIAGATAAREFPTEHYLLAFDAAWQQVLRATNPLYPGLLVPLLAIGGAAWWWAASGAAAPRQKLAGVIVAALPLLAYGQVRLPAIPASIVQETPGTVAVVDAMSPAGEDFARVYSWLPLAVDYETRLRIEAAGRNADVESYRLLRRMLAPNFGITFAVPLVDGYENLMTREQALIASALGSERAAIGSEHDLNRLGLGQRRQAFGERWGVFIGAGGGALLTVEAQQPIAWPTSVRYEPRAVRSEGELPWLNVFRVARPWPRAFLATEWTVARSAEDALEHLLQPLHADGQPPLVVVDPERVAGAGRAEPPAAGPAADRAPTPRALDGTYEARIVRNELERVDVEVHAGTEALLVLLDAYSPGWTATVSGVPQPILAANVAFRAVRVPAGRNLVTFRYVPPYWMPAIAITVVAGALIAAWLAAVGSGRWAVGSGGETITSRVAVEGTGQS